MDDFQVVRHKGRKRHWGTKKKKNKESIQTPLDLNHHIDIDKCRKQIQDIKCSMVNCTFWRSFKECLEKELTGTTYKELVLYGIGSIGNSSIARHQLSLILLILDQLKIHAFFHDPILTQDEKSLMKELGLDTISCNEECKRKVLVPTVFVMFHCGKAMYNNLLWANWNQLHDICIIGNTFSTYSERIPNRILEEVSPYIKSILPFTNETEIENNYELDNVFNDSSIHTFPIDLTRRADPSLWELTVEPIRNEDDVEIITKKSENED